MTTPQKPLIRRCRWCENRIGATRHFIEGEWQQVFSAHHVMGDVTFTDGICPECHAAALLQIRDQKLAAVVPVRGELAEPITPFIVGEL